MRKDSPRVGCPQCGLLLSPGAVPSVLGSRAVGLVHPVGCPSGCELLERCFLAQRSKSLHPKQRSKSLHRVGLGSAFGGCPRVRRERERVCVCVRERECCILVLDSVTSTPQWIRQQKPRDCAVQRPLHRMLSLRPHTCAHPLAPAAEMFSTIRQFSDLKVSFTQLALDQNGNDVAALLTCEPPLRFLVSPARVCAADALLRL